MTDEAAGGGAGVEVPEARVPSQELGEGELAVGGDHDNPTKWEWPWRGLEAVGALFAGEGPEDDSLVAGGGQEHVGVVEGVAMEVTQPS